MRVPGVGDGRAFVMRVPPLVLDAATCRESALHADRGVRAYGRTRASLRTLPNFGGYFPQYRALNESHCTTIVDFKNGDVQERNLELKQFIDSVMTGSGNVLDASETSDAADRAKPFNLLYWTLDSLL